MASGEVPMYPSNVTYFNFTATSPADGHCEWKQYGHQGLVAEPANTVFAIMTSMLGLFGLHTSNQVATGTRYMFSLLLGYGLASAGNTWTLWNGFDKTAGCILNLMQAVIITRLVNSLKFPPFNEEKYYHHVSGILMSTFGLYPVIAHIIGSSVNSPWTSWLTFDLIWAAILVIVLTIFYNREKYPQHKDRPDMFTLVFSPIMTCVLAYTFWLVDTFACCRLAAMMNLFGLWLVLMGLTFYYLAVLDGFLQSSWQNYTPIITRWPKKYVILYVSLQWEKDKAKND